MRPQKTILVAFTGYNLKKIVMLFLALSNDVQESVLKPLFFKSAVQEIKCGLKRSNLEKSRETTMRNLAFPSNVFLRSENLFKVTQILCIEDMKATGM